MDMMSYLMGRNSGSAKKGAKIEVVTELPETGESNVIYLVPKQDEDENNVFDEYIWINDDWELIGTTDIDLSDYYTKSEVDGKLPPIYALNTTNQLNDNNGGQTLENDAKTRYSEIITDAYAKGYKNIAILLCSTSSGKAYMFYSNAIISTSVAPDFYADCTFKNHKDMDVIVRRWLIGYGTWNNGVFTLSGSLTYDVEKKNLLYSNNSTAYTPTPNSYNPATTKYVDDSIANKQDVLTAGSNITIENNVISSTGGTEEVPSYVLNMHTEHDGLWYLELDNIDKARIGEIFTDAYEKGYESINVLLKYKTTASVYAYQVLLIPLNRTNYSLTIQNKPVSYRLTSVFHAEENINYVDNTASLRFGLCLLHFYGSWTNNVFTVTTASYKTHTWELPTNIGVLTKTNTVSYTPTANYHPSTKLYSDTTPLTKAGLSPYSTRTTYQAGDYVYRSSTDLTIYKCNTADTTGTWNSSKWDEKTYMEYLSDTLVGGALNGSY